MKTCTGRGQKVRRRLCPPGTGARLLPMTQQSPNSVLLGFRGASSSSVVSSLSSPSGDQPSSRSHRGRLRTDTLQSPGIPRDSAAGCPERDQRRRLGLRSCVTAEAGKAQAQGGGAWKRSPCVILGSGRLPAVTCRRPWPVCTGLALALGFGEEGWTARVQGGVPRNAARALCPGARSRTPVSPRQEPRTSCCCGSGQGGRPGPRHSR